MKYWDIRLILKEQKHFERSFCFERLHEYYLTSWLEMMSYGSFEKIFIIPGYLYHVDIDSIYDEMLEAFS